MKVFKKVASVCLALVVGISSVVSVSASEKRFYSGTIDGDTSEYDAYIASLSDADLARMNEKIARDQMVENKLLQSKEAGTRSESLIHIPGTFTMYYQIDDCYCTPACVQSILNYINGSSDNQLAIAIDLGTTSNGTNISVVPGYLNDEQDDCIYLLKSHPSQGSMISSMISTIQYDQVPCLMNISDHSGSTWGYYATDGHSLVVIGIKSEGSSVRFADPLGYEDDIPTFYYQSKSVVTYACDYLVH